MTLLSFLSDNSDMHINGNAHMVSSRITPNIGSLQSHVGPQGEAVGSGKKKQSINTDPIGKSQSLIKFSLHLGHQITF